MFGGFHSFKKNISLIVDAADLLFTEKNNATLILASKESKSYLETFTLHTQFPLHTQPIITLTESQQINLVTTSESTTFFKNAQTCITTQLRLLNPINLAVRLSTPTVTLFQTFNTLTWTVVHTHVTESLNVLDVLLDFDSEVENFQVEDDKFAWVGAGKTRVQGVAEIEQIEAADIRRLVFAPDGLQMLFIWEGKNGLEGARGCRGIEDKESVEEIAARLGVSCILNRWDKSGLIGFLDSVEG
ncbi:hypothetical protein HK096_008592, partial [Nowakowskiella sp. JEL0078]